MLDIEEVKEKESPEQETFECPSCGQPVTEFLYHSSRRGWVKCSTCGKDVGMELVPKKFIKKVGLEELEPEKEKEKERKKEKATEREEWEKERGRVPFLRPRSAWTVLEQIRDEFGVKPAAKKIIIARCRRIGELHPTYVADEYYFALQSGQQQAEEFECMTAYPRWGRGCGGAAYGWSRFLEKYHVEAKVSINVKQTIPEHVGLGSGTQLALAVATALAKLFNIQVSVRNLALVMGRGENLECRHCNFRTRRIRRFPHLYVRGNRKAQPLLLRIEPPPHPIPELRMCCSLKDT
ncbi:MAG: hypothetical protein NXY59_03620 [Aigarchaeota archaeon]|nr:hypothetical protein [Candidatus Pelearchaeum maunauluense]